MLHHAFGSIKMQTVYLPLAYQVILISLYQWAVPFIIHKSLSDLPYSYNLQPLLEVDFVSFQPRNKAK